MPRPRRSLTTAVLTAACALTAAAPAGAAGDPTTAFARGLAPLSVARATPLGGLSPRTLNLTLALAPRDPAGLDALVAGPHAAITPSDFNARFAPAQATVDAVRAWASASGLAVTSVSANRLLVRLSGPSAAVGRAFGVGLSSYRLADGTTYWTPDRTATMPASIARGTTAVLGLSSLGRFGTPKPAAVGPIDLPRSYGPKDFWALYHAPATATATGQGQAVSVIAEGDLTKVQTDLRTFEAKFGLPQVPWTQTTVGTPSADTSGGPEWDLDTQYSTGFAPDVSGLHLYVGASLGNDDIAATINRWVTDNATRQASFSAGECELLAYATGFTDAIDTTLKQAVAQGQTLFTSSGDTGSFCPAIVGVNGIPAGLPNVNYPASSPYAVGVGGTTVVGPGPTEVTWYGTGGGPSAVEPAPAFQSGAGGSFLGVNRGVPDVALDADPESGYRVIVDGTEQTIGGTSASAPAWQGIWARAQGARGGALGFAGPVIYREPASAFHDILVGANGAFPTTPGWDYDTGRGTPDITAFVGGA